MDMDNKSISTWVTISVAVFVGFDMAYGLGFVPFALFFWVILMISIHTSWVLEVIQSRPERVMLTILTAMTGLMAFVSAGNLEYALPSLSINGVSLGFVAALSVSLIVGIAAFNGMKHMTWGVVVVETINAICAGLIVPELDGSRDNIRLFVAPEHAEVWVAALNWGVWFIAIIQVPAALIASALISHHFAKRRSAQKEEKEIDLRLQEIDKRIELLGSQMADGIDRLSTETASNGRRQDQLELAMTELSNTLSLIRSGLKQSATLKDIEALSRIVQRKTRIPVELMAHIRDNTSLIEAGVIEDDSKAKGGS